MADTANEPTISRPSAELIPIWEHNWSARWLVSVASDRDPTGEDYWSGWADVDASAITGMIEFGGYDLTPAEARNMAEALRQAANHVEQFARARASFLDEMTHGGNFPEINHLPSDQRRTIRDALRAAAQRYRLNGGIKQPVPPCTGESEVRDAG